MGVVKVREGKFCGVKIIWWELGGFLLKKEAS